MATLEDLVVKIGADTSDAEKGLGGLGSLFDSNLAKLSAAGAVAGAGLEAFARGQQDSNAQTLQLAASLGITETAMRDLAMNTADAGFPLAEVLDLMETGKQQGLRSADALQEYAKFWDTVGDATGENAVELGKAGTALASMGIEAGNEAEALQALGFIQEHTTQGAGDFLSMLGKVGPDLAAVGLDVNDTAALLGILEQEMGLTGRQARTELNEALAESDGTFSGLIDTLGITETQLDGTLSQVEESGGILERNAQIVDDQITPLQKVQQKAEELMFQYGGLAEAAGMLAMPLMALGPAVGAVKWIAETAKLIAYKAASLAVQAATKTWAAIQWVLNVAMSANPIGLIILAIIALIAIIVLIATKTTWFQDLWRVVWGGIKDVALAVGRWFKETLWEKWILGAFNAIMDYAGRVWEYFKSLPGKLGDMFRSIANFITAPFRAGFNAVVNLWNNSIGKLSWTVPSWVPFIGGKSIQAPRLNTLPAFHQGGVAHGEVIARLRDDEGVFTPEQMANLAPAGGQPLVLRGDGTRVMALLIELVTEALRVDPAFRSAVNEA